MTLKNKINLSVIVFFLLNILLVIFLIKPIYIDIQEKSEELIFQKKELAFLENKIRSIKNFREYYPERKGNLDKLKSLLVESKAPVNFISFLEKSSRDSQVPIDISLSKTKQEKDDVWSSMIVGINSTSLFSNFLKFLEKLESAPYLLKIDSLNITRLTEKELASKKFEGLSLGYTNINLSLKVFVN